MKSTIVLLEELVCSNLNSIRSKPPEIDPSRIGGVFKFGTYEWEKNSALDRAITHLRESGRRLTPQTPAKFENTDAKGNR